MSENAPQQNSRSRAFEALASVRAFVKANHGSQQQLVEMMTEKTGDNIARHTLSRWLRDDLERFQQPSLGHALALFECVEEIQTSKQP